MHLDFERNTSSPNQIRVASRPECNMQSAACERGSDPKYEKDIVFKTGTLNIKKIIKQKTFNLCPNVDYHSFLYITIIPSLSMLYSALNLL